MQNGKLDLEEVNVTHNKIDALRHSFVSGVFTMEYNESVADILGRLNELVPFLFQGRDSKDINMDLWNNAVGRKYGKKSKSREELFKFLIKALNNNELIIDLKDPREYEGASSLKTKPNSWVIVLEESKTGENLTFYDLDSKLVMTKSEFVIRIQEGKYPDYSVKVIQGKETPVSKKDRFNFNNLG